MKNRGLFVAGTDTEIGKTMTTLGLMSFLQGKGEMVTGMKPVASGALMTDQGLRNDDAVQILSASNYKNSYNAVNPFCFEPPVAPSIAAIESGIEVKTDIIVDSYEQLAARSDRVIMEGVGGWWMLLGNNLLMSDVVKRLGLPVILTVGMRLGCINHAVLTARAIQQDGLKLLGWIANCIDPDYQRLNESCEMISRNIGVANLGIVPWLGNRDPARVVEYLDHERLALLLDIKSNVS